ncbi:MAG: class II aldolase/adducin family protein [Caldilineales bacterium]
MTSGNISGRDPQSGLVVIKPSGYSYEAMTPADMVVVDLDGTVVEGHLKPSTDTATHLYIYRHRPDVFGIGHAHLNHLCIELCCTGLVHPGCADYFNHAGW